MNFENNDQVTYSIVDKLLLEEMDDVRTNSVHEILRMRDNHESSLVAGKYVLDSLLDILF